MLVLVGQAILGQEQTEGLAPGWQYSAAWWPWLGNSSYGVSLQVAIAAGSCRPLSCLPDGKPADWPLAAAAMCECDGLWEAAGLGCPHEVESVPGPEGPKDWGFLWTAPKPSMQRTWGAETLGTQGSLCISIPALWAHSSASAQPPAHQPWELNLTTLWAQRLTCSPVQSRAPRSCWKAWQSSPNTQEALGVPSVSVAFDSVLWRLRWAVENKCLLSFAINC